MSTFQGIAAACEAVLQVLRSNYRPDLFGGTELEFKVYTAKDFSSPMQAGVSLFLYRVTLNEVVRSPGRRSGFGAGARPPLPVDLHVLMSVWGRDASLQHTITGWMMRCLEDTSIIPSALLNASWPGVFRGEESLEIVMDDLSTQELLHMWERLNERGYALSIPYVARFVKLETGLSAAPQPLVGQPRQG